MNKVIFLISLFVCNGVFAISCQNNGNMLNTGYDISKVIQICGEPISKKTQQQTINVNEKLTYYKDVMGNNVELSLNFSSGRLVNIHILDTSTTPNQVCQSTDRFGQVNNIACPSQEKNVTVSGLCGRMIKVGHTEEYVRSVCGSPADQTVTASRTQEMTELKYAAAGQGALVFLDKMLVGWKY